MRDATYLGNERFVELPPREVLWLEAAPDVTPRVRATSYDDAMDASVLGYHGQQGLVFLARSARSRFA